jgi:sacsin
LPLPPPQLALLEAQVPILDPRFDFLRPSLGLTSPDLIKTMAYVHTELKRHGGHGLVCQRLKESQRQGVLEALVMAAISRARPGSASALTASEISMLCSVPVWPRAVSQGDEEESKMLDEATLPEHLLCPQDLLSSPLVSGVLNSLPPQASKHLLLYRQAARPLYSLLDIKTIDLSRLLSKLAVPYLHDLPNNVQLSLLSTIHDDWKTLRSEPSLVSSLKSCTFVTCSSKEGQISFSCPSDLLDPFQPLLYDVFQLSRPELFPSDQFKQPSWLAVLRDLGLKSKVDADLLIEVAKEVERRGVESSALLLLSHLREKPAPSNISSNLSSLAILPASTGLPGSAHCLNHLVSFKNAALLKDAALVFTSMPWVKTELLPSSSSSPELRIRSPPPLSFILKHLHNLDEGGEEILFKWPLGSQIGSIESAFASLFSHLDKEGLSKQQVEEVKKLRFIPVANCTRMAKPSQLFFHLPFSFSPVAFEVPSFLLPHSELLQSLGASDEPSAIFLLQEFDDLASKRRHFSSADCIGVADILMFMSGLGPHSNKRSVSDISVLQSAKGAGNGLWVLSSDGELVKASSAFFMADRRIINRLGPSFSSLTQHLTLVHPLIHSQVAKWLGCSPLEDAVREELDVKESNLEKLEQFNSLSLQGIKARISSSHFIEAVHSILRYHSSLISSIEQLTLHQTSKLLRSASQRLTFITSIQTKAVLASSQKTLAQRSPMFFECHSTGRLYVCVPLLSTYRDVAWVLCEALSDVLGSPVILPLLPLMQENDTSSEIIKTLHPGRESYFLSHQASIQSLPGSPLLSQDLDLIQLKPLRRFYGGEIVAIKKSLIKTSSDPASATALAAELRSRPGTGAGGADVTSDLVYYPSLVYARISADFTPTDEDGVCLVPLDIGESEVISVLNTEVFSFRMVGPRDQAPRVGSASKSIVPASSLVNASGGPSSTIPHSGGVSSAVFAAALEDLLASSGIPLDMDRQQLMASYIEMKQSLATTRKELIDLKAMNVKANQELEASRSSLQCKICFSGVADVAFVGCGHIYCSKCSLQVQGGRCPQCRRASATIKLYR